MSKPEKTISEIVSKEKVFPQIRHSKKIRRLQGLRELHQQHSHAKQTGHNSVNIDWKSARETTLGMVSWE